VIGDRATRTVEITDETGLHARPAATFAEAAAQFVSDITISHRGRSVDAKSVLLILTLDVRQGDEVSLEAQGPDAEAAVDALARVVATR
jgi:phosphocarrier protein